MAGKALKEIKRELLADKEVRQAYEGLADEYAIAREVIAARNRAGLTQAQLAERMNTSQSYIARLESGKVLPTLKTMRKVAEATQTRVHISLVA